MNPDDTTRHSHTKNPDDTTRHSHTMRRTALGVLFYTWLYGTPFLLVVALIRRTAKPFTPTRAEAEAFGATTDTLFLIAMVTAVVLPAIGAVIAKTTDEPGWTRHFVGALIAAPLLFVILCAAGTTSSTPVIGHVPADLEPPSPVHGCAHECPGG
ncbi:hypothetical protein ACFPIJ_36210 [Dactylosporangium cerinum]|uniref:DUF805 domain-containing protein n=1 Tax=Dactylosporangium cerinum TaxID=1434730 RepID=A0ABV9W5S6_9ACTN